MTGHGNKELDWFLLLFWHFGIVCQNKQKKKKKPKKTKKQNKKKKAKKQNKKTVKEKKFQKILMIQNISKSDQIRIIHFEFFAIHTIDFGNYFSNSEFFSIFFFLNQK